MKIRLLIPGLLVSVPAFAWQPQTGDIIFQISRSSQSKAIQLATHSDYSHTGMLVIRNKKPYVECAGNACGRAAEAERVRS